MPNQLPPPHINIVDEILYRSKEDQWELYMCVIWIRVAIQLGVLMENNDSANHINTAPNASVSHSQTSALAQITISRARQSIRMNKLVLRIVSITLGITLLVDTVYSAPATSSENSAASHRQGRLSRTHYPTYFSNYPHYFRRYYSAILQPYYCG